MGSCFSVADRSRRHESKEGEIRDGSVEARQQSELATCTTVIQRIRYLSEAGRDNEVD